MTRLTKAQRARDPVTGQYAYEGEWDRVCLCGHTLGVHLAGGFDCIVHELDPAPRCACTRFRSAGRAALAEAEGKGGGNG